MTLEFDPVEEAARRWREHFGEANVAQMRAITSLMRVHQIWLARVNAALSPFELTFARYEVLMLLHFSAGGALSLGKIGERLQVHPASVTNLIDGLEHAGRVTRERHPRDGRATLARLTGSGRETALAATAALHTIRFGIELSDEHLDRLSALLRGVRAAAGDFSE